MFNVDHLSKCLINMFNSFDDPYLVRPIRERIWRATRVGVVGWPVFEHLGAVLTPLGGGTIDHS